MRFESHDGRAAPAAAWTSVDPGRALLGWSALVPPSMAGSFAAPEPQAPATDVVSLADRRAAEPPRAARREIPGEDILVLARPSAGRPADPPVRETVLDLAEVATPVAEPDLAEPDLAEPDQARTIPFPGPAERDAHERRRRLLYLVGATVVALVGALQTYMTATAPRVISVPDTTTPGTKIT